ncbi:MAG: recombinase family protein [Magnetococcales bacterium]|nr:recombinase family protein [Magnetococcales bacterium]
MNEKQNELPFIRAAQYVRMSTEHQQYSTDNQSDIIKEYARKHGMEIIRTYADEGKSGLNLEGRLALQQMLEDVQSGAADYEVILVYDISRWGRFQDADQSAYYEYVCKRNKIRVEYCAEMFTNDGSTSSVIIKNVKRAMAGEYSRELSKKVFIGQCRLIQLGYRQGGMAGYGLRRMLVNSAGIPQRILKLGERKILQTERVILVPGPEEEVATVQWIYDQFVNHGRKEAQIAKDLNERGLFTEIAREIQEQELDDGGSKHLWTSSIVNQILTNEKYIGNNIYNRQSFKLKEARVVNPPDMWVRANQVFEPIVDQKIFYTAQGIVQERNRRYSNEDMLELLKQLYRSKGFLSGLIIDEAEHLPNSNVYAQRFGSLVRAYKMVGYTPDIDYSFIEINKRLREMHPKEVKQVISTIEGMGGAVSKDTKNDLLTINDEFTASLVISRCMATAKGTSRWNVRFDTSLNPDLTIVARMDADNEAIQDFYLIPAQIIKKRRVLFAADNGAFWDSFRFDTLDFFFAMARRASIIRRAA